MTIDANSESNSWKALDELYHQFLNDRDGHSGSWLIQQALLTSKERRSLISSIDVRSGWNVLDVGTGYGTLALELAHLHPISIVGVDKDDEVLTEATRMAAQLSGWLNEESSICFQHEDVTSLSFDAGQFDLITARLLFQHIAEPEAALDELVRVVRRGGYVWIFDVDDAMSVSHPPASEAKATLDQAFASWQTQNGGDREIGRKLPSYLSNVGLYVVDVSVISQAQFTTSHAGDRFRTATSAQYRALRDGFVSAKVISQREFDLALESFQNEPPSAQLRIESQVVVLAQKP